MGNLKDPEIRSVLITRLREQHHNASDTLIIEELGLNHGDARIDVAVLNGHLHGYEVKSDSDTLTRLPAQMQVYNSVLDRATIIAGRRHLRSVLKSVPSWWGIELVETKADGTIALCNIQEPGDNPDMDLLATTNLLWRDEALALLEEVGCVAGFRSKPRSKLYTKLTEVSEPKWLKAAVYERLRCRIGWLSGTQRVSYDD